MVFRGRVAVVVGFPGGSVVKDAMQEMWVRSPGQDDPLEKEVATHSSILAQRTWRRLSVVMREQEGSSTLQGSL